MEVTLWLSCAMALLLATKARGAAIETPLDLTNFDNLSPADRQYLEYLQEQSTRTKRSDLFSLVKHKLAEGVKSKIGHIASASKHASGGKDYHHYEHEHYDHHYEHHPEVHQDEDKFDFWDLQKSILYTLLQAAKAIKGGLLAVKGHLIKGSGYILSAKGKLISAKGEAITSLGKHIAHEALLSKKPQHNYHSAPSAPEHEYHHSSGGGGGDDGHYSAPSGHGIEYQPSAHGAYASHKVPHSVEVHKDHIPRGTHHGILILKKIPKGHKDKHKATHHHHVPEKHKPAHKPDDHHDSSHSFLPDIKGIFAASSYKEPEEHHDDEPPHHHSEHDHHEHHPDLHGLHALYHKPDESSHHHPDYHDESHSHHDHDYHHTPSHYHDSEHKPSHHHDSDHKPSHYHDSDHKPSHYHDSDHKPPHYEHHESSYHDHKPSDTPAPSLKDYATNKKPDKPLSTSYGTPIAVPDNSYHDLFNKGPSVSAGQAIGIFSNQQVQLPQLETYDPLKLPNGKYPNLGVGSQLSYPLALTGNFGGGGFGSGGFGGGGFGGLGGYGQHTYAVREPDADFKSSLLSHSLSRRNIPTYILINSPAKTSRRKLPQNYHHVKSYSMRLH